MTLTGKPTLRSLLFSLIVIGAIPSILYSQEKVPCEAFQQTIKTTYNFRPALLANEAEREKKSAAMDKVWASVKGNPAELLPCLRRALEDPKADSWFLFDGSNLLVSLDDSKSAKELQIKNYAVTNLEDIDLRVWVMALVRRAAEGFDVSVAGERWLSFSKARYFLPEHGAYEVNVMTGALFIFGSMEEAQAVPALLRIISQSNHPGREAALAILLNENTPESLRSLQELDVSSLSAKARNAIRHELTHPDLFEPRSNPRTSRSEFLDAFTAWLNGDRRPFLDLTERVPDGERDVVATLTPEDLPLIRKVRRRMISGGNQHSIEFYASFTKIIRTIMFKTTNSKSSP